MVETVFDDCRLGRIARDGRIDWPGGRFVSHRHRDHRCFVAVRLQKPLL